jgi:alpha-beta hydrolase superfamily lysophospholipase
VKADSSEAGRLQGSRGVDLQVRQWGPPRGTDPRFRLLLIHGFQEHSGRYEEVATALASAGGRILAFDQRGHGLSSGRRGDLETFEDLLDDVDRAWALLGGADVPGFVLGHSMGGLVALRWVQTRGPKLAGLVLSAPWLATAVEIGPLRVLLRGLLERFAPGFAVRQPIDPESLTRDPERQEDHRRDPLKHQRVTARFLSRMEDAQVQALELGAGCDTLLLSPDDDPVVDQDTVRSWARGMGGSRLDLVALPDGLHEPFQDVDRQATIRRVLEWIRARV